MTGSHLAAPDAAALSAHLARVLPAHAGRLRLAQLGGGQSNPTYRVETPAGTLVLRRKPPGPLLPSAHAIEREARVMRALGRAGFPVPEVLDLCEDAGVIGTAFYLMPWLPGRVLFATELPGMTAPERTAHYHALIDTLAALHRLDPAALGLGDFGRPGGYVGRQIRRWSEQYRASETRAIPAMERLIGWLPDALADLADETCLVHGDYRLDNVMWAPEAPRVLAVMDWELSTLGHPLADLSYFLMTWSFPVGLRYGLAGRDLAALGIPHAAALAERYCEAAGRAAIPALDRLLAYNVFRMAAILQGVHARGLQGNAASPEALAMGGQVEELAGIAWDLARAAGA